MDSITEKLVSNIARMRDQLFYYGFESCGYSRDWVLNNMKRIKIIPFGMEGNFYYEVSVDDRHLFTVTQIRNYVASSYSFKIEFDLEVLYGN